MKSFKKPEVTKTTSISSSKSTLCHRYLTNNVRIHLYLIMMAFTEKPGTSDCGEWQYFTLCTSPVKREAKNVNNYYHAHFSLSLSSALFEAHCGRHFSQFLAFSLQLVIPDSLRPSFTSLSIFALVLSLPSPCICVGHNHQLKLKPPGFHIILN